MEIISHDALRTSTIPVIADISYPARIEKYRKREMESTLIKKEAELKKLGLRINYYEILIIVGGALRRSCQALYRKGQIHPVPGP